MNKILSLLLAFAICSGLWSCDVATNPQSNNNKPISTLLDSSPEKIEVEVADDNSKSETDKTSENEVSDLNDCNVTKKGCYTSKDEVALYIHKFNKLPSNFIKKGKAKSLGWNSSQGNLDDVAPGKSIGGDKFGNYEGQLPKKKGRQYFECDIDYKGGRRNAKRIIYSNDGLVFYTNNHYKTFEQLY